MNKYIMGVPVSACVGLGTRPPRHRPTSCTHTGPWGGHGHGGETWSGRREGRWRAEGRRLRCWWGRSRGEEGRARRPASGRLREDPVWEEEGASARVGRVARKIVFNTTPVVHHQGAGLRVPCVCVGVSCVGVSCVCGCFMCGCFMFMCDRESVATLWTLHMVSRARCSLSSVRATHRLRTWSIAPPHRGITLPEHDTQGVWA